MYMNREELTKAIAHDKNPRIMSLPATRQKVANKLESLLAEGLLTPLLYNKRSGRLVKGTLRSTAILSMSDEQYAATFPKGVSVKVVDVSDDKEEELRQDHSESESLEKVEVYLAVCAMIRRGWGFTRLLNKFQPLLVRFIGASARCKVAAAIGKPEYKEVATKAFTGTIQTFQRAACLPEVAEKEFIAKLSGAPVKVDILDKHLRKLAKAMGFGTNEPVNPDTPSRAFKDVWAAVKN